jgi:hypothetical protein
MEEPRRMEYSLRYQRIDHCPLIACSCFGTHATRILASPFPPRLALWCAGKMACGTAATTLSMLRCRVSSSLAVRCDKRLHGGKSSKKHVSKHPATVAQPLGCPAPFQAALWGSAWLALFSPLTLSWPHVLPAKCVGPWDSVRWHFTCLVVRGTNLCEQKKRCMDAGILHLCSSVGDMETDEGIASKKIQNLFVFVGCWDTIFLSLVDFVQTLLTQCCAAHTMDTYHEAP